jgi:flagellar M-ring protein FliF
VRGDGQLPGQTVNAIRFLVANAVEGLRANNVTVVDNLGNVLSENSENDTLTGLSSTQLSARKSLEQYLAKKAEDMLATVLGPGQAVVRVAAEINFDSQTRTEEKYDPDVQVTRISTINDENTETTTAALNGGVPGVSTNSAAETNNLAAGNPSTSNHTRKKVTNNQYEVNKTTSSLVQAAGGIKRLSAAVFVAARTEGTGADRKAVPRSTEELEKLRRIVQSALGAQDSDRKDTVTLEEMPFNDQPTVEVVRNLELQEKRQFWWDLAGKALYPGLALAMLLIFWRLFKKTPNDGVLVFAAEGLETAGPRAAQTGRVPAPPVTVEVLNQLLRENPGGMTQAIRSWMDRGKGSN